MIYRQIAHKLRIPMGPGRPDLESERPRHKSGRFLDLDEDGLSTTRIEIPDELLHLVSPAAIEAVPRWRSAGPNSGVENAAQAEEAASG